MEVISAISNSSRVDVVIVATTNATSRTSCSVRSCIIGTACAICYGLGSGVFSRLSGDSTRYVCEISISLVFVGEG